MATHSAKWDRCVRSVKSKRRRGRKRARKAEAVCTAALGKKSFKKNPRRVVIPREQLEQAAGLYLRFREAAPKRLRVIKRLPTAKVLMIVGNLVEVMYDTDHAAKSVRYRHTFRRNARPLLCSSSDGRQLFILDGRYDFTGDGIVDR